jgi:hypothetical protein
MAVVWNQEKKTTTIPGMTMQEVEIKVKGEMDRNWSDWFGGLNATHTSGGYTTFTGSLRDQAELRGVLLRLADLGLELTYVSVKSGFITQFMGRGGD